MKIKVSDYLAQFLQVQNTDYVFEVAGGMIAHFLDSLYRHKSTTIISVHHEQAAAFAIDAYGRIHGRPSVALATSGPGATNLLTGIGSCYFDSSPSLFITGQVNTHEKKRNRNIRQLGFQEADIVGMAKPVTKKCYEVEKAEEIPTILEEAYKLTISGRPGPVLLDIPMDLQRVVIDVDKIKKINVNVLGLSSLAKENVHLLIASLKSAKSPLVLVGGGIRAAQCKHLLNEFLTLTQLPVVTSLMGLDAIAYDNPLRVGFIGSYGNRWANNILGTADVLLVIGSRLDIRQTGSDVKSFAENKKIFHVDCEEEEINNRLRDCIGINADLRIFFKYYITHAKKMLPHKYQAWLEEIDHLKQKWPDILELGDVEGINPNILMHQISAFSKISAGYIVDVGAHQMWAAQSLELAEHQFFMTSGGMGAMGFSIPAAIGACLASDKKPVVVIVGDGSMQMNIQELQTIVRNMLPIKIIVINNQSLGMITQFQDSYFESRYQSTYWGYSAPKFTDIATAYKIDAKKVTTSDKVDVALKWLWSDLDSPSLLEIMIQPHLHVYPKIAFGRPITEMEPFAKPIAMEST